MEGLPLPGELPSSLDDVTALLQPAGRLASSAVEAAQDLDTEELQNDIQALPGKASEWFAGLDDPVQDLAPPAAYAGATVGRRQA